MRPYSRIKAIWGLSLTYFSVFRGLGQSGATGPKEGLRYPLLGSGGTNNNSKHSTPHFTSNESLFKHKSHLRVEFYLFYCISGIWVVWGNWDQRGPQIPNSWYWDIKSHSKYSTPHFTSNEFLLKHKGHLKVEFYLFCVFWALRQSGESGPKWDRKSPIIGPGETKSHSKSSITHFTSNEALFKHKGHLRSAFYLF